MAKALCKICGGSAEAETFDEARWMIDHSVGKSRSISCGTSSKEVYDVSEPKTQIPQKEIKVKEEPTKSKKESLKDTKTKNSFTKEKYL